jgi:hypothetical protein
MEPLTEGDKVDGKEAEDPARPGKCLEIHMAGGHLVTDWAK